jgi:hypothetical protein
VCVDTLHKGDNDDDDNDNNNKSNSHIGHCTHTAGSANVKVQKIYHCK